MLKFRPWLLALAACIPCLLLIADDADDDREPDAAEVDWDDKDGEGWDDRDWDEPVLLDEPVQLEFFIDEGDGIHLDVVCAAEDYQISIDMGNLDGENHVEIGGTIKPLNDEGRLFLSFHATIHHSDLVEGGELTFSAEGSTIVELGQRAKLATFPGPTVSVTVSAAE